MGGRGKIGDPRRRSRVDENVRCKRDGGKAKVMAIAKKK